MYNNMDKNPIITVGIGIFEKIIFETKLPNGVQGKLTDEDSTNYFYSGKYCAFVKDNKIVLENLSNNEIVISSNEKISIISNYTTKIENVEIGIGFHWQRKETQEFPGHFLLRKIDNKILLINLVNLEEYITSVISSEMNGNNSLELLKAHAVISRSWVMCRKLYPKHTQKPIIEEDKTITWQDSNSHTLFDVCADDHCQRYQGITRAYNPNVKKAVEETIGEFLVFDDKICDARFSKCCGGVGEEFETCWQDIHYGYLEKYEDLTEEKSLDLTNEVNAENFIKSSPQAYCNTTDKNVLSKILNSYDNEYQNFFRWKLSYTKQELSEIIKEKSGEDFGEIIDLQPLERGVSGRIKKLKIIGTKKTKIIGKELEIRRLLSKNHLYSSAFTIENNSDNFVFVGAGWGHGVGLCQIGAAVMAEEGKDYKQILSHYYKGAIIKKYYNEL